MTSRAAPRFPVALYALAAGAFGIGTTEFVIMGLLQQVAADMGVSVASAGLLITGYALGVFVGAPVLTLFTARLPRKTVLVALMVIFTLGNLACALAPAYAWLMSARVLTALAHGTFFGVGSIVATRLVAEQYKASAISIMFTGLTVATLLGVPAGAWLGLHLGWRATFFAVAGIGVVALAVLVLLVPATREPAKPAAWREEVASILRAQVLLALLTTVLGFAGVFVVMTYIQPLLIEVGGFSGDAVSLALLLFGIGMILGNMAGGRLADRRVMPAIFVTLAALALVLLLVAPALQVRVLAYAIVALLGAAAFATVSPLQMRVLQNAAGAGQTLASSFNIAAFNLGNALGAWLGSVVVDRGPGLAALGWIAAMLPIAGLAAAYAGLRLERSRAASSAMTASSLAAG
jgi:DHA1 family inner membrane transport protein